MTKHKLLTFLLLAVLSLSATGNVQGLPSKRKKKHHRKTEALAASDKKNEEVKPEEEDKESAAVHKETKKERKKREKKEKKERREKEKKERKEKRNKKDKIAEAQLVAPQGTVRRWQDIEYVPSQRKSHYRVDILAPLFLDELVKGGYVVKDIPEKANAGLNFYKGVQIAADSLKKAQFDVDIYVHDVASLLESVEMLLSKDVLDSSDLIIGAVNAKDIPALAAYAHRKRINFVSAFSGADESVKDNQYFTVLQPSLKRHYEWVTAELEKVAKRQRVLMLYRTYPADDNNAYNMFAGDAQFVPLLCNKQPDKTVLAPFIDTDHTNIIMIPVVDMNSADSLLKVLGRSFPRTHFEVYGMPSWGNIATLHKAGVLPNVSVNITSPFNFTGSAESIKYVEDKYAKDYGGKPQEFVYRGYEATFWYVNMLRRHGTIFNKQYDDVETAPFTRFEITPRWDNNGNILYHENKHIFVSRYENGLVKTTSGN